MNPSMITDDVGREFLEANGITVEEALELANIDDFPDEGPSSSMLKSLPFISQLPHILLGEGGILMHLERTRRKLKSRGRPSWSHTTAFVPLPFT